jgi:hypothetical protein
MMKAEHRNSTQCKAKLIDSAYLSSEWMLLESWRSMQPNDQELSHAAGDSRQPEIRSEN